MKYIKLNFKFKIDFTLQLLKHAKQKFPEGLVMSSSLGRYSAVMLHLASTQIPGIPVINIRLDEETASTKKHREQLSKRLDLNLRIFDIRRDKAETIKHAFNTLGARALISGVLWGETEHREGFEYFMEDETFGVQRVYPLLHWKQKDLEQYIETYKLPINQDYVDSFKENSEKKECGIHIFQNGGGI